MQDCMNRVPRISPGDALPDTGTTAEIYVALGDRDKAFGVRERLYRLRDGGLILANADPSLGAIKSDPRFQQLVQRIGLPPFISAGHK
jgi:hypothetical protein